MEGTQIPTNIASCFWPLKKVSSEKMRERNAATNNNLSVSENFLNIVVFPNIGSRVFEIRTG